MAERIALPSHAAWRHTGVRDGFEVAFFQELGAGLLVQGHTAAVEDGEAFVVRYRIELDELARTRSAHVSSRTAAGFSEVFVEADGTGAWEIDGKAAPMLDGCLDLDLESSSLTNAFPIRRRQPAVGDAFESPAAYVRAADAAVERIEQHYTRRPDDAGLARYRYEAPAWEVVTELVCDEAGLVVTYPGLADRAGG